VPVGIVQHFTVNFYFTVNKISEDGSIAYSTEQRRVEKLETASIIQKASDNKRDKVYCANGIICILEESGQVSAGV
jgi:predicted transcriptional regulator